MSPTTPIVLDRTSDEPLYRQIERQLRTAIRSGQLRPRARLPGVRTLARALGVARITVTTAYEQLAAEGYVEGRIGSGTSVASDPPGLAEQPAPPTPRVHRSVGRPVGMLDLRPDAARLDDFPFSTWERLLREAVHELSRPASQPVEPAGDPVLREVLAARLGASRAIVCASSQIVVTTGEYAAVSTIADAWPGAAGPVLVEDPGPPWIEALLAGRGRRVVRVPADEHGLRTDALPVGLGAPVGIATLVHLSPAWGAILGGTLSADRRRELFARVSSAVRIVEDDRDGELRLAGPPPPALAGQDPLDRVIHVRGLERDLYPGARLGYLVVPTTDIDRLQRLVEPQGRGPGTIEQRALARFVESGSFDRHLRRLRQRLIERQAALVDAIERHGAGRLAAAPASAGRHLVVRILGHVSATAVAGRAVGLGVRVGLVDSRLSHSTRTTSPAYDDRLLVGFGGAEPPGISEGVRRLVRAIEECRSAPAMVPSMTWRGWPTPSGERLVVGSTAAQPLAGPHGLRRHEP
jgi:GntR family transcriptional regulator/MocR family aminotransferase